MIIHTALHPPRAEAWVGRRRAWACATLPGEDLGEVVAHLAGLLLSAGVCGGTVVRCWPRGGRQSAPVSLGVLARDRRGLVG